MGRLIKIRILGKAGFREATPQEAQKILETPTMTQ